MNNSYLERLLSRLSNLAQRVERLECTDGLAKNNRGVAAVPGVGDDSADGYGMFSLWIDTTGGANDVYICISASAGAAVWKKLT